MMNREVECGRPSPEHYKELVELLGELSEIGFSPSLNVCFTDEVVALAYRLMDLLVTFKYVEVKKYIWVDDHHYKEYAPDKEFYNIRSCVREIEELFSHEDYDSEMHSIVQEFEIYKESRKVNQSW
jgi:hypothetical protein